MPLERNSVICNLFTFVFISILSTSKLINRKMNKSVHEKNIPNNIVQDLLNTSLNSLFEFHIFGSKNSLNCLVTVRICV